MPLEKLWGGRGEVAQNCDNLRNFTQSLALNKKYTGYDLLCHIYA